MYLLVPVVGKPIYKFRHLDRVDRVNWSHLSGNPNAIHLLENNLDKVDWYMLSGNSNAIHLLENNLDKVDWYMLSGNSNAIHLLENNLDKVDWNTLPSNNPNAHLLFSKLDYQEMKIQTKEFSRELVEYVFHPERLFRIGERNALELGDLLEML